MLPAAPNQLTDDEIDKIGSQAKLIAMRLLALCCPKAMPSARKGHVTALLQRYEKWCETHFDDYEVKASDSDASDSDSGAEVNEPEDEIKDALVTALQKSKCDTMTENLFSEDAAVAAPALEAVLAATADSSKADVSKAVSEPTHVLSLFESILDFKTERLDRRNK